MSHPIFTNHICATECLPSLAPACQERKRSRDQHVPRKTMTAFIRYSARKCYTESISVYIELPEEPSRHQL